MSRLAKALVIIAFAMMTGVPGAARADEPGGPGGTDGARITAPVAGELTWRVPAGCPDADAFVTEIATQLGRAPADAEATLDAEITLRRGRWRLHLVHAGGERTIDAASCDELTRAAALIVAMTIDPSLTGTGDDDSDEPGDDEAPPAPATIDTRTTAPARRVARRPGSELAVRARAVITGDLGGMPGVGLGWGGGLEVGLGAWSLDASGARWLSQAATAMATPDRGADIALTSAALRACRHLALGASWRAAGCLGGELDILQASGFGYDDNFPPSTTFGGGGTAGLVASVRLGGPLRLRVDAGVTALARRPVVTADQGERLHAMSMLVGRLGVAIEVESW